MKKRAAVTDLTAVKLQPGEHAALLYDGGSQLDALVDLLATPARYPIGFLGYERLQERVAAQLRDLHNLDLPALHAADQLCFFGGAQTGRALLNEVAKFAQRAAKAKRAARLVVCLGFDETGWPDEDELLDADCRLNELCVTTGLSAFCLYDARQVSGTALLHGCLECHPLMVTPGEVAKNPLFVAPTVWQKQNKARRGDDKPLSAWMS